MSGEETVSQEPSDFATYIANAFKRDLDDYLRENRAHPVLGRWRPQSCSHHGVPHGRTVGVVPVKFNAKDNPRFWAAWYVTTLLNEAVHTYAKQPEQKWLETFGSYPVPMEPAGMGCWSAFRPRKLLGSHGDSDFVPIWDEVCAFVAEEGLRAVKSAGIEPSELVRKTMSDKEFAEEHVLEGRLARRLRVAVGLDGWA